MTFPEQLVLVSCETEKSTKVHSVIIKKKRFQIQQLTNLKE